MYGLLIAPFVENPALLRAMAGVLLIAIGSAPVGVFLMLRRMSLTGDALSHGILPGVAIAYFAFGLNILPMTIGGLIAGSLLAVAAGAVSRFSVQNEDASLASFYLISLASGVVLVSLRGESDELVHLLFGSAETLSVHSVWFNFAITLITLAALGLLWRGLVAECLDPLFFRSVSKMGALVHFAFLILVVLNLVNGYQALGTLLSVALMMLPATAARFWANRADVMCLVAVAIGVVSSIFGLLVSHHYGLPSGPSVTLVAGVCYLLSLFFGTSGIIRARLKPHRHRVA